MTDSLPTISDIKSISQEEFDRMSAPQPGSPDNTAASVSVVTRSLPTGVTPNTSITSADTYYRKALLNFLVKASNGLINVHSTKPPTTNAGIKGKPDFPRSHFDIRLSNVFSRDLTQRASGTTNMGEQATRHTDSTFIMNGRSNYPNVGVHARGYRPPRSDPLPRTDKINTLKRKLQESQEALCTLKKLKQEGVMWSDNGDHPVDLTVTGKVGRDVHTFRPHPVGVGESTSARSPDIHHVTKDVSRSTRDAQSHVAKNSSKQNPVVKKRRRLSEIVNSLASKKNDHENWP
ncbi:Hypp7409 [Branchiostoma lanceolatum]|uniref:Hypp7409 protein n=1 Tax=Branchiostoma lanceolatum TaxID=7740 RepID=A0A8J9YZV7_BRALA|nr:Hypp7409 [Branchiostoma lanceolatum]